MINFEYDVARGFSEQESIAKAQEHQITFLLQKCIARYGLEKGCAVWPEHQKKWQTTLSLKSDAEKLDIMRRQVVSLGRASRESLAIFEPLRNLLIEQGICKDDEIYYGYETRNEWYLGNTNEFYLYDFCVPKLKLIIEYQGKIWHPDYRLNELTTWKNPHGISGFEVRANDNKKKAFAEQQGYQVTYIWGSDDQQQQMRCALDAVMNRVQTTHFQTNISNVERLMKNSDVNVLSADGFLKVIEFHTKHDKQLYELFLTNGYRLTCSDDHYVRLSTNQWISVRDLVASKDKSLTTFMIMTDVGPCHILGIIQKEKGVVNDLTVDHPEHSYYTGGITSHNTGKTLLAIAAGLEQLKGIGSISRYEKLIVTRPVQPVGKEIGFLPGTLEEKMEPWIAPIRDNLNFLMNSKRSGRARKQNTLDNDSGYLSLMQEKGLIEIEAITFIRGRSISNAFIIIDEAQNLSMHELKTIITRVGDGTKIILTGDIEQIDNVHVDIFTNGLTYAIEKFKEQQIAGHVTLLKGERSELATLAAKIL